MAVGGNDGLFALLNTATLLAVVVAVARPSTPRFAVAGGVLGLATLCRAPSLFLPLLLVPVALMAIPKPQRRWLAHGGALLGAFAISQLFPRMQKQFGDGGTFGIYAAITAVAILFIWAVLPETKGRTLEEIEQSWMRGRSG